MKNSWDEDRLIRVNMSDMSVTIEDFPEEWQLLGGRALSARILINECDASCDPLGPDNILVLAPGVLSGSSAPTGASSTIHPRPTTTSPTAMPRRPSSRPRR